jgi:hypothetical protein
MIFHAPVLALLLASLVSAATLGWAAMFGLQVVRHWDIDSGSRRQIEMEKRTYLVTTLVKLVLVLELASLILFVVNADAMASLFTGAMCAVGTLNNNAYGFPALLLKLGVFFGAAVWLIVNRADEMGRDYPLTRHKYWLLIALAPLVVAAGLTQLAYFSGLRADVITSCCSRLFVPAGEGVEVQLAALPPGPALGLLLGGFALVAAIAWWLRRQAAGRVLYAPVAAVFLALALTALISVISSYVYERPHHHCPFCLLKGEYGYVGYALYLPLFAGTAFGLAAGLMAAFREPASLAGRYPALIRGHIGRSAGLFAAFIAVALWLILRSHLVLLG